MVQAVGEVIDRPHAPDAEEGDRQLFAHLRLVAGQADQPGHRPDHQQDDQRRRHVRPDQPAQQPVGQRRPEQQEQRHHRQPLDLFGRVVHLAVEVVSPVRGAKGQRGHEHRQEPVGMDDLGQPVGHEGRGQRDQPVAGPGQLRFRADAEGEPAEGASDQVSARDTRADFPQHVVGQPFDRPRLPGRACGRQRDRQVDERKRRAVVHARLRCQAEPHLVLLACLGRADLHVRGENRIGRGKRGRQQQRHRPGQPKPSPAEQRDRRDAERQGHEDQPPCHRPSPQAEDPVELQPRAHQGDDDDELGEALGQLGIGQRRGMQVAQRPRHRRQHRARGDADDGQRQRQTPERQRQPRDQRDQEPRAGQDEDVGVGVDRRDHGMDAVDAGRTAMAHLPPPGRSLSYVWASRLPP